MGLVNDAAERLLNLAMFLARSQEPVTAEQCRESVAGYSEDQELDAFLRMFERDKDELRRSGLVVETVAIGETAAYRLDGAATFASPIELTPDELTILGLAGAALADDPSFPFGSDLRMALAKLALETTEGRIANPGTLADEEPPHQGRDAALLADAIASRKRVRFDYTKPAAAATARNVRPYGLFSSEGRWYLVGRDDDAGDMRVFALSRMGGLTANDRRPGTPDFDRPKDFDVAAWAVLPFQMGPKDASFDAELRFEARSAWRAPRLAAGRGALATDSAGEVTWRVTARDADALLRWVVENGPGIRLVAPKDLSGRLMTSMLAVAQAHDHE